jgi:chemotaxis signal transduction protein
MNKDVLLIRSGQFHLAVPTERLLEIVDLDEYHAQQKNAAFRLWRNHVLPVLCLNHILNPTIKRRTHKCPFSIVYQASDHKMIYLDIDHVFSIVHIDTSQMRPVYHLTYDQKNLSVLSVSCADALAFVLESPSI